MTATLIGATGLIGSHLLPLLLEDDYFDTVRVLVRKPFAVAHSKLEVKLVDFSDTESYRLALEGSDVIFCSIGTTQKKVNGDKAAYRKIDYDIPVQAARLGKLCGCETFVMVSAIAANSKSNNFYIKLKGETEDAVKASGIRSIHIMQPSLLLGHREEYRFGERVAQKIMKPLSFLFPAKWKPVPVNKVAQKMWKVSKENKNGVFSYTYSAIVS